MDGSARLEAEQGVVETELEGRVALFQPATQQAAVLNQTASDIWLLTDGSHDLDEIVTLLASAYQVEGASIRADVEQTVRELRDGGFLR